MILMRKFTILTDSACDLPQELADKLGLRVVPLSVTLGGKNYRSFLDEREISFSDFYSQISAGKPVSTSAANIEQFRVVMESEAILGNDVLYLGLSSGISSTYSAAQMAAKELRERYPQTKFYVLDSLCASMGTGLMLSVAAAERDKGKSIEEVYALLEEKKWKLCHWFTVADLKQLQRGGRIGSVSAVFGTLLNIKPVLHVDNDGKLQNVVKARGRNASINEMFRRFCDTAIEPEKQTVYISHGNCPEDAKKLAEMIRQKYGCESVISYVGPLIGAHSGEGTLALFFFGTVR